MRYGSFHPRCGFLFTCDTAVAAAVAVRGLRVRQQALHDLHQESTRLGAAASFAFLAATAATATFRMSMSLRSIGHGVTAVDLHSLAPGLYGLANLASLAAYTRAHQWTSEEVSRDSVTTVSGEMLTRRRATCARNKDRSALGPPTCKANLARLGEGDTSWMPGLM